jgi:hypothetical protein
MHYGGLAGIFIIILGALFYAFVKKSIGAIILIIGLAFLAFYYVF